MTNQTRNFLVEIGTEELPPKSLKSLAIAFQTEIERSLTGLDIGFSCAQWFATPRRLAVLVKAVEARSPDREEISWGPPTRIAFDDSGTATKAALAFASRYQLSVDDLSDYVASDGKTEKLRCARVVSGKPIDELLGPLVETALEKLPVAKRMRWGSSRREFVRPIHWICMLLDNIPVEHRFFGSEDALAKFSPPILSGNVSRGHRFHADHDIAIGAAIEYEQLLEKQGQVVVSFERRQQHIKQRVSELANEYNGHAVIDTDLLEEVTALVEWPEPLVGQFDKDFLNVPAEALISSMKEHQKYFHVKDDNGNLLPLFITVSNIRSSNPELVVAGNERVIRPRLADAAFFYRTDLRSSLSSKSEKLNSIVFQAKLGSIGDKVRRITLLASAIANLIDAPVASARKAAELSKCDLVTEMVSEFDSLQGVMGRYYAQNDGEEDEVALAIEEQYLPRFAGDKLPSTPTGISLALADRLDTLTGIFGIGEQPSGSRDPFALRRSSVGILRILVEHNLPLDLSQLISLAIDGHSQLSEEKRALQRSVHEYILGRFSAWFEAEGISPLVFPAVRACETENTAAINLRVQAVQEFLQLPEASSLAAANKRVANLLPKAQDMPPAMSQSLLSEDAEIDLANRLDGVQQRVSPLLDSNDYTEALRQMAALREPLDQFFDQVLVMTDEIEIRGNRLALLRNVRELFLRVADVSLLAVS